MTQPGHVIPPTKLGDLRGALHDQLKVLCADVGWPAERAHRFPPARLVTPACWVDVPTVHQAPTESARAVAATFPVVVTVDGSEQAQLELLDPLLAYGWTRLESAATKYGATVQSGGPDTIDVGGATTRGLLFRVQLTLLTRTLCQQSLVQN